jgi:hypothetical protein
VEERIGLVFTWDPRAQHWVKERGPEDAPPPPADPIDNGALQTYFLDPQTGRWNGTILGLKGRQISVELGEKYRTPRMVGLAIIAKIAPKASAIATPDQKKSSGVPMMAGIAAVVVVIAAGAFAAQAVMRPKDVVVDPAATVAPGASGPVTQPSAAPSAEVTVAPSAAPTSAPTQAPVRTPQPTVAPTAPPPVAQTVTYSSRLPNNTVVTYRGPNAVNQGAQLDGVISVIVNGGAGGTEPLTLYIGPLGTAQTAKLVPDRNGNIAFSIRVSAPKGAGQLSFSLGANGELRILGPITVR